MDNNIRFVAATPTWLSILYDIKKISASHILRFNNLQQIQRCEKTRNNIFAEYFNFKKRVCNMEERMYLIDLCNKGLKE